jgi:hypothetical protein
MPRCTQLAISYSPFRLHLGHAGTYQHDQAFHGARPLAFACVCMPTLAWTCLMFLLSPKNFSTLCGISAGRLRMLVPHGLLSAHEQKEMPPAGQSGGHQMSHSHPVARVRRITLSEESSAVERHRYGITPEAWRSWGSAVRYLIVRLADAAPCALLVWLAYLRR